jgi:hypothetical protein
MYAKNSDSSSTLYIERLKYEDYIETTKGKYFLGEFRLIGKLDNFGNILYPNASKFVSFRNSESETEVSAFDFVIQNFKSAYSQFESLTQKNLISSTRRDNQLSKPLSNLNPVKGFTDPQKEYKNYLSISLSEFLRRLKSDIAYRKKILNFSDYCSAYFQMVLNEIPDAPIYLSMYHISNHSSPLNTGLALEFYDDFYDNDLFKSLEFFSNQNFIYFRNVVNNHGFKVDKVVPWRIIADIYSEPMQNSLKKFNPSLSRFDKITSDQFTSLYYKPIVNDLELLIYYLLADYNDFAKKEPVTTKQTISKCFNTSYEQFTRSTYKRSDIGIKDMKLILKFYIQTKNKISRLNYSKAEEEKLLNRSLSIIAKDPVKSINLIDSAFNTIDHFEGTPVFNLNYNNKNFVETKQELSLYVRNKINK